MKIITKLKKKKGFTIIELLCAIAIIGMLAALAIPQFSFVRESAKKAATVSNARTSVSTIIGLTALYEKEDWYAPRNSGDSYDYSSSTMSNYLEKLLEAGEEGSNNHSYINQYSGSEVILNWSSSISGTGEDPAVFITNTSTYSYTNSNSSNMSQLKGSVIVYFDTEETGEGLTTDHIEVYYTDETGLKCDRPFIIVM